MNPEVELTILPPPATLPQQTAAVLCEQLTQWQTRPTLPPEFQHHRDPLHLAVALDAAKIPVRWLTATRDGSHSSLTLPSPELPSPKPPSPALVRNAHPTRSSQRVGGQREFPWPTAPTILALIPHWRCEPWLPRCLRSLCQQTHPLTNIVVIDDASPQPPVEIVRLFPQVTLLQVPERVGPYGLIQSVINRTCYDAYLFQDADDWSSGDRLATLLATARHHSAELVGSQEIRVLEPEAHLQAVGYPLEVNQALRQAPGHALLHPTSLVTRSLVQWLGGFATGLRFGGDTEFLLRAHWCARIVNTAHYGYFRRKRPDSLTTAAATGLGSPVREALTKKMKARAIANAQAAAHGQPLDLRPLQTSPDIPLRYLCGPELQWSK